MVLINHASLQPHNPLLGKFQSKGLLYNMFGFKRFKNVLKETVKILEDRQRTLVAQHNH